MTADSLQTTHPGVAAVDNLISSHRTGQDNNNV